MKGSDQKRKVMGGILAIAFFSYFIQNMSVFDTPTSLIMFYLLLAFLCYLTQGENSQQKHEGGMQIKHLSICAPIIALCVIWLSVVLSIQPFLKSRLAIRAKKISQEARFDEGLTLFKKAVSGNYFTNRENRQMAANMLTSAIHQQAIPDDQHKKWVIFLQDEMEKNIQTYPHDVRQYLIGSLIYRAAQKFDARAIDHSYVLMQKALVLAPKKFEVLYEFSQVEAQRVQYDSAILWAERAIDQSYDQESRKQGWWNKATITIRAARWKEAALDLQTAWQLGYPIENNTKIIYLFAKNIPKPVDKELLDRLIPLIDGIQARKMNIDCLVSKVLLYHKAGESEKEQLALQELNAFNNKAAEQIKEMLK